MRHFIINEQQVNAILAVLAKYPAGEVIGAIDILRSGIREYVEPIAKDLENE